MTMVGVTVAVLTALLVGYLYGRRVGARTPTWRRPTSRVALGRQAAGLLATVALSEAQRWLIRRLPAPRPQHRPRQ